MGVAPSVNETIEITWRLLLFFRETSACITDCSKNSRKRRPDSLLCVATFTWCFSQENCLNFDFAFYRASHVCLTVEGYFWLLASSNSCEARIKIQPNQPSYPSTFYAEIDGPRKQQLFFKAYTENIGTLCAIVISSLAWTTPKYRISRLWHHWLYRAVIIISVRMEVWICQEFGTFMSLCSWLLFFFGQTTDLAAASEVKWLASCRG